MGSADSIPGTGLSQASSADLKTVSDCYLLRYVFLSTREVSRNEEGCALPPVVGFSGTSADTNACMSDHLEAATKVRIKKGFDSFSIFS